MIECLWDRGLQPNYAILTVPIFMSSYRTWARTNVGNYVDCEYICSIRLQAHFNVMNGHGQIFRINELPSLELLLYVSC